MSSHQQQPAGTFLPGTKVTVGSHKVYIEKYLSEGGFAHVYVVRVPRDNNKHDVAVLKRVAVPDKEHLASMRTEVETMKKLKGHRHIVTYIDSHASQLQGGGYEVFLLMEFCSGGGLIDFMNTRLQHRLTEPEILKIFGDVSEGVATMHYLKPPLLHRDLKVENVLISKSSVGGSPPLYKLCDFGSTAPPRPAARTPEEGRLIEEDVQKHTTMQYRSPEMIDVWRKQPIDEKADIWALGVLLYKLCYYTTPFEDVGQMAILNASYKYPAYPSFSDRVKKLIAWMLKEDPKNRPNIFQVIKEVCAMRGTDVPIKDIYSNRTQSEARRNESLPSPDSISSAPIGLQKTAPQVQVQAIPDIAPMRRGRPGAAPSQSVGSSKPTPSPARGDPFAALDSKNYETRAGAVDELSKKFPSLDEFSIALDGGAKKFAFSSASPSTIQPSQKDNLNERVTNALADQAFSQSAPKSGSTTARNQSPVKPPRPAQANRPTSSRPTSSVLAKEPKAIPIVKQQSNASRAESKYKSTAVGSSPPATSQKKLPDVSSRPIWRVPEAKDRTFSSPRPSDAAQAAAALLQPSSVPPAQRPAMVDAHRSKSQTTLSNIANISNAVSAASSSRPSLESQRPSAIEKDERTQSNGDPPRTSSMYVSSDMDYLRNQEQSRSKRPSLEIRRHSRQPSYSKESSADENAIDDNMDFLRAEEGDLGRRRSQKKEPQGHRKRSSLNALSGAKQMLSGRFGDAFKRFEGKQQQESELAIVTPPPGNYDDEPRLLSPIAGSEAAHSRHSDMDSTFDETEDLPLDVRREMERRRLSQEERRVAEAAAEYRSRVAMQGTGTGSGSAPPPSRASTIQKRVQSLLDEGRRSPAPKKTAAGYGHYTDVSAAEQQPESNETPKPNIPTWSGPPIGTRKPTLPTTNQDTSNNHYPKTRQQQQPFSAKEVPVSQTPPSSISNSASAQTAPLQKAVSIPRPSAPPKPKNLRTGGQWPPSQQFPEAQPLSAKPTGLAALLAKDLEGVPDYPPRGSSMAHAEQSRSATMPAAGPPPADDDFEDFSKRYPSLSGIEMVETEIAGERGGRREIRVKDV